MRPIVCNTFWVVFQLGVLKLVCQPLMMGTWWVSYNGKKKLTREFVDLVLFLTVPLICCETWCLRCLIYKNGQNRFWLKRIKDWRPVFMSIFSPGPTEMTIKRFLKKWKCVRTKQTPKDKWIRKVNAFLGSGRHSEVW